MGTCENCEFWDEIDVDNQMGSCRKNAPIFMLSIIATGKKEDWGFPETHEACWPITYIKDWCGEFKKRNAESPAAS